MNESDRMGVDVYLLTEHKKNRLDLIELVREIEKDDEELKGISDCLEVFINSKGDTEWLMHFSMHYMQWLCWIITVSGGDPGRIDFVDPGSNIRFIPLIPHGHPWKETGADPREEGIVLTTEECKVLLGDIAWFINEKIPRITDCEYLKGMTHSFFESLDKVISKEGKMLIG